MMLQIFLRLCRCIPTLPDDVRARITANTAGINSFYNTASTRLRRYLADIGKAKWLIIASGGSTGGSCQQELQVLQDCLIASDGAPRKKISDWHTEAATSSM